MEQNQTNQIKQSENTGQIIGILKDKQIEFAVGKESGKQYAKGHLVIEVQTPEGLSEIKVHVMQMALKSDGTENGLYKSLQTIHSEYKTKVANGEDADLVKVDCSLEMNDYYSKGKDEVVSFPQVKGFIFNRVTDKNTAHMAQFKVGGYVESIVDKDNGDANVNLVSIGYGAKAFPLTITVPAETAGLFKSIYYVGCTADFNFDLINAVEIIKETQQVGFGKPMEKTTEKRTIMNKVFGASNPYTMGYTQEEIVQVNQVRKLMLETKLTEGREKAQSAPQGGQTQGGFQAGFGGPAPQQASQGFGQAPTQGFGGAGFSTQSPFAK